MLIYKNSCNTIFLVTFIITGCSLSFAEQQQSYNETHKEISQEFAHLASSYAQHKNTDKAITFYKKAVEINPDFIDGYFQIGRLYKQHDNLKKAIAWYRKALARQPGSVRIMLELANTLNIAEQNQESLELYTEVLDKKPNMISALYNFGFTLKKLGHIHRAIEIYKKVLAARPAYPLAHFAYASALLTIGDYERGWREYEWRWQAYNEEPRKFDQPMWDGSDPFNKTIFIYAEQGLGDTFQFVRYAKELKERGATVILQVQKPLKDIIQLCPYVDLVVTRNQRPKHFDYHIALMSLPLMCNTTLKNVPKDIPYLYADKNLVNQWKNKLAHDKNFKIGICFRGNTQYQTNSLKRAVKAKSVSVEQFKQFADIPGVTLYSLQKMNDQEEVQILQNNQWLTIAGPDIDKANGRFMDTAAIIANLDLVITIDTSIAHLAGGMGKETWLLLPKPADWRWMLDRDDTPWYPQMRLFRQKTKDNWLQLFDHVMHELTQHVADHDNSQQLIISVTPKKKASPDHANDDDKKLSLEELKKLHAQNPANVDTCKNLCDALKEELLCDEAIRCIRTTIAHNPRNNYLVFDLANTLNMAHYTKQALNLYLELEKLFPASVSIAYNIAYTYKKLNQIENAMPYYKKALALQPDHVEANFSLGLAHLCTGDFIKGFEGYEWRWKNKRLKLREFEFPMWDGVASLKNKTIFIYAEQGLGDTFQFVRYLKELKERGAFVVFAPQNPLNDVMKNCPYINQIIKYNQRPVKFDYWAPLLTLPYLMKTSLQTVPHELPYLFAKQERIDSWNKKLEHDKNFKIGICWQGNPNYNTAFLRNAVKSKSLHVKHMLPLLDIPGVSVYSLQRFNGTEQLDELDPKVRAQIYEFDESFDRDHGRFQDTVAVLVAEKGIDLMISIDTSMCHCAAGLGVPTLNILPNPADWRWMLKIKDTPWYKNMKLFRQEQPGDWDTIMKEIVKEVKKRIAKKHEQK